MDSEKKLIFLADDDKVFLEALQRYLEQLGIEVMTMGNGFDVLTLCQYIIPDIIISDIRMPKLDGISLMKALNNSPKTERIPIIFMSAYTDDEPMQKAKVMGARFFLFKPFPMEQMEQEIEKAL